jgi:hypothetical protein
LAVAALLLPLVDCGGKRDEYVFESAGGATIAAGGGSATGTTAGGHSGAPNDPGNGGSAVTLAGDANQAGSKNENAGGFGEVGGRGGLDAVAGAPGDAGAGGANAVAGFGSGGAGGEAEARSCASVTECPRPANACITISCVDGSCVTGYVVAGAFAATDSPADCHATTACDGSGNPTLVVDQDNAPTPLNPCLAGTCNATGTVGSEPLHSGTRCSADFGGGKCDGNGSCVQCLKTADCLLGQTCNAVHACLGEPCSEQNCGGACPACAGSKCATDQDCATRVCDAGSHVCVVDPQCKDQEQNGNETDVDCGGGTCSLCAVDKACLFNVDCSSQACDAISLTCVVNNCVDHRFDSDESDLDCGGTNAACPRCDPGKKCFSNWDCVSGHFCNGGKICQ